MVFRSKAQCEANGRSLVEHWNAAAGHHRFALRVSLSTPTVFVPPLGKGTTITYEARLAVSIDKLTELAIITLKEYWGLGNYRITGKLALPGIFPFVIEIG